MRCKYISFKSASESLTANEIFLNNTGINVFRSIVPEMPATIFAIDDIQSTYCNYGYRDDDFWSAFLKLLPTCPNIRVILSATYRITDVIGGPSPASFENMPRLVRKDFLLTEDDAAVLFKISIQPHMRSFDTVMNILVHEANGHIGVISLGVL